MSKNKKNVKIRKYEKADHDVVCRIFYNGLMENWLQSYKRTINLGAPFCSFAQFIQLYAVFQYLQSFLWFLLAEFFIQSVVMFICFYRFWALAWEHLSTDLRDKEISQWTCRGLTKAGLFVATIDDEVVGMVCYSVKDKVLEIFRISTAVSHRGQGVGRRLLDKMERTAAIAKCEVITLKISTASEDAIKFHIRHGYHVESCYNLVFTIIDMFQSVILKKEIKHEGTSRKDKEGDIVTLTRSEHLSTVPE